VSESRCGWRHQSNARRWAADLSTTRATCKRKARCLLIVAILLLCTCGVGAQNEALSDGTIVAQTPCAPNPVRTYEQYMEAFKRVQAAEVEAAKREGFRLEIPADLSQGLLSREEFERHRAYAGFECRRITYLSDGLKVVGFIWKPQDTAGKQFPLIIFNRGGNREFGKLTPWFRLGFYAYVSKGFVIIASQYRGNDGGEGHEECGGADVRDILHLIPLARALGYIDMHSVSILGWSRGGMMTYLALQHNIPVNAVAVGGLTDLVSEGKRRPALARVWRALSPGFEERGEDLLRERSAVYWAEKINVPALILHGGADWRSEPMSRARALANRLHELGKTYELIIYPDDDHGLSLNRAESDRRVVEWFRRHMQ
jgi:dipeptidyl aminopeptidase/acylaminoacyl peptidase